MTAIYTVFVAVLVLALILGVLAEEVCIQATIVVHEEADVLVLDEDWNCDPMIDRLWIDGAEYFNRPQVVSGLLPLDAMTCEALKFRAQCLDLYSRSLPEYDVSMDEAGPLFFTDDVVARGPVPVEAMNNSLKRFNSDQAKFIKAFEHKYEICLAA